jgi:hypothetical protein
MSAVGTAVIQYIADAWGLGWTFTFLGLFAVAASPCLTIMLKWGPKWREERFLRQQSDKEAKRDKADAKAAKKRSLQSGCRG